MKNISVKMAAFFILHVNFLLSMEPITIAPGKKTPGADSVAPIMWKQTNSWCGKSFIGKQRKPDGSMATYLATEQEKAAGQMRKVVGSQEKSSELTAANLAKLGSTERFSLRHPDEDLASNFSLQHSDEAKDEDVTSLSTLSHKSEETVRK